MALLLLLPFFAQAHCDEQDFTKLQASISEREIPDRQRIGNGYTADGSVTIYQGEKVIFIQPHAFVPGNRANRLSRVLPLSKQELHALKAIDLEKAKEILTAYHARQPLDFAKMGLPISSDPKRMQELREIAKSISDILVKYDNLREVQSLHYGATKIAPRAIALVKNDFGLPSGFLTEFLPGEPLIDAVKHLSPKQIESIKKIALAELDEVHRAGFVHGDPNPKNIFVDLSKNPVEVRFIDFSPPLTIGATQEGNPEIPLTMVVAKRETPEQDNRFFLYWFDRMVQESQK